MILISMAGAAAIATISVSTTDTGSAYSDQTTVQPRVVFAPNDHEFAELYPARAYATLAAGRSSMLCNLRRNQTLDDCRVTAEAPAGLGFGDALLASAKYWRIAPAEAAGRPTDAQVRINVEWVAEP